MTIKGPYVKKILEYSSQNMYNRSISFKVLFLSHLIYKWRYHRQTIFNQLDIMESYLDGTGLCHSVAIWKLCDAA